jgi:hypothetical protein
MLKNEAGKSFDTDIMDAFNKREKRLIVDGTAHI